LSPFIYFFSLVCFASWKIYTIGKKKEKKKGKKKRCPEFNSN
jgi:hypothetical protein